MRDWYDPQTLLAPLFSGYDIEQSNNANAGQVSWQDAPGFHKAAQPLTALDQAIKKAESTSAETARARAWATVDNMLVANAVGIPWLFGKQPMIESHDVHGVNEWWDQGGWDYAYTSLR